MKKDTQTISRKALAEIYPTVQSCAAWKGKLVDLVMANLDSEKIEVPESMIAEAYKAANPEQKKLVEKYFKLDFLNPYKVNNLADVYKALKVVRSRVIPFPKPKNKLQRHLNAAVDINHITTLLNGKVKLNFNDHSQYKYAPYFRKDGSGRWVVDSYGCWSSAATLGSGLYYKSSEDAMWAGKTFEEVYNDYLPE